MEQLEIESDSTPQYWIFASFRLLTVRSAVGTLPKVFVLCSIDDLVVLIYLDRSGLTTYSSGETISQTFVSV